VIHPKRASEEKMFIEESIEILTTNLLGALLLGKDFFVLRHYLCLILQAQGQGQAHQQCRSCYYPYKIANNFSSALDR
jgi:hypothetical protein